MWHMTCSMKIFDRSLSSERSLLYMRGRDFDGGDPYMAERKYIISILDKIVHFDNIGTIKNHRSRVRGPPVVYIISYDRDELS